MASEFRPNQSHCPLHPNDPLPFLAKTDYVREMLSWIRNAQATGEAPIFSLADERCSPMTAIDALMCTAQAAEAVIGIPLMFTVLESGFVVLTPYSPEFE